MNRAVHGDVIVVEMFDQKEWKSPADEVVDQEGRLQNTPAQCSSC
jgi:exosome complex exonuclease DIS3/RRP44